VGTTRVLHHVRPEAIASLRVEFPDVAFVYVPPDELDPMLAGEVLLTTAIGGAHLDEVLARGVRWIHTIGTGVDRFPLASIGPGQVLTCSRGASAIPIAEWVLAVMLAFSKQLPESFIEEPPPRWATAELGGLHGQRLAILGLGSIGLETGRRALAFGMKVRGLRRSLRPAPADGIEVVGRATAVVEDADHVVVATPATEETRHLVSAALLDAMKPGVHLVNIARGAIVDQQALRVALDRGHVARASLDTVEPEPLPAGHWMYSHPRVRLSPHISWSAPGSMDVLYDTFRLNLRSWLSGLPLDGVVDATVGY
jgi:phosphoglycerate dehydrogenase-like enzyme